MSVKFYKNEDGRIDPEDTILDDLSEMIRDETDEQLDDDQVAELATKMLNDMVDDGSLVQVDPKSEKPINEEMIINGLSKQDIEDWKNLNYDSEVVQEIDDDLEAAKKSLKVMLKKFERSPKCDDDGIFIYNKKYTIDIKKLIKFVNQLDFDDAVFDQIRMEKPDYGYNKIQAFLIVAKNFKDPFEFVKELGEQIEGSEEDLLYRWYEDDSKFVFKRAV